MTIGPSQPVGSKEGDRRVVGGAPADRPRRLPETRGTTAARVDARTTAATVSAYAPEGSGRRPLLPDLPATPTAASSTNTPAEASAPHRARHAASDEGSEAEEMVAVPASVLKGLTDRLADLEKRVDDLTKIALDKPASPVLPEPELSNPGGPLRIFSADTPIGGDSLSQVEKNAQAKAELLTGVDARVAGHYDAIVGDMHERTTSEKPVKKEAPKRPSYEESPEAYHQYVKRYGKDIDWTEPDGTATYAFKVTYVPHPRGLHDLVGFHVRTEDQKKYDSGNPDTTTNTVRLAFDGPGKVVELDHTYQKTLGTSYDDGHRNVTVRLGADISVTDDYGKYGAAPEYTYNPQTHVFDQTGGKDTKLGPLNQRDVLDRVDAILDKIPTMRQ